MRKRFLTAILLVAVTLLSVFTQLGGGGNAFALTLEASIFPDDNFRSYLEYIINNDPAYSSLSDITDLSFLDGTAFGLDEEIALAKKITSLKGIETLTDLEYLNISGLTKVESLDVSTLTNLQTLTCGYCTSLAYLKLGDNEKLWSLEVYECPAMYEVDVSGCPKLLNPETEDSYALRLDENIYIISDDETRYAPRFHGKSLMLSGNLGMYFYLKLPVAPGTTFDDLYGASMVSFDDYYADNYVAITEAEKVTVTEIGNSEPVTLYGFRREVSSVEMADHISPKFIYTKNGKEKTIDLMPNIEYPSDVGYRVKDYLDALTAKNYNDDATMPIPAEYLDESEYIYPSELVELANAMKDYGHYAQKALKVSNAYYAGHEDMEKASADKKGYTDDEYTAAKTALASCKITSEDNSSGLNLSYTLLLDSATTLEVYVSGDEAPTSAKVDGASYTLATRTASGDYVIAISNIPAHELNKSHTIELTTSNGTLTVKNLSALSYAEIVINADSDRQSALNEKYGEGYYDLLKDAVTALYYYHSKTAAYIAAGN